jgi:hypothetical protein
MRTLYFRLALTKNLTAALKAGEIDQQTHDKVRKSLSHRRVRRIMLQLSYEGYGELPPVIKSIWDFVVANWPTILKIALTLIALAETNQLEDDE